MEWISVEDRLPAYNEMVLLCAGKWIAVGYRSFDDEPGYVWCDVYDVTVGVNVTHWMPLPAPPAVEARAAAQEANNAH